MTVGVQPITRALAFRFVGPTTGDARCSRGSRLDLRFSRAADIDIAELRASPPRFVREIRRRAQVGAPVRLQLTLDAGVRQRHLRWRSRCARFKLPPEGGVEQTTAADNASAAPPHARAPAGDRHGTRYGGRECQRYAHHGDVARGGTVRRRSVGKSDLAGVLMPRGHGFERRQPRWAASQDIQIVHGAGHLSVCAFRRRWRWWLRRAPMTMHGRSRSRPAPRRPRPRRWRAKSTRGRRGRMTVRFGREGVVRWINDPEIGDRIAVAMLGGPRGVDTRRATLQAADTAAARSVRYGAARRRCPPPTPTACDGLARRRKLDRSGCAAINRNSPPMSSAAMMADARTAARRCMPKAR